MPFFKIDGWRLFAVALSTFLLTSCATSSPDLAEASENADSEVAAAYVPEGVSPRTYRRLCKRWQVSEKYQSEDALEGKEPRAVCKIPPQYPESCMSRAARMEVVTLQYDVTPRGGVENIRLIDASNECLIDAAIKPLSLWSFEQTAEGAQNLQDDLTLVLGR